MKTLGLTALCVGLTVAPSHSMVDLTEPGVLCDELMPCVGVHLEDIARGVELIAMQDGDTGDAGDAGVAVSEPRPDHEFECESLPDGSENKLEEREDSLAEELDTNTEGSTVKWELKVRECEGAGSYVKTFKFKKKNKKMEKIKESEKTTKDSKRDTIKTQYILNKNEGMAVVCIGQEGTCQIWMNAVATGGK